MKVGEKYLVPDGFYNSGVSRPYREVTVHKLIDDRLVSVKYVDSGKITIAPIMALKELTMYKGEEKPNTCKTCFHIEKRNFETDSNRAENIGYYCVYSAMRVSGALENLPCYKG